MAYKKPEVVAIPSKQATFSVGGEVKMIFGKTPTSLAGCDTKGVSK